MINDDNNHVKAVAPDGTYVTVRLYVRGSTYQRLLPIDGQPGLYRPRPGIAAWEMTSTTESGWTLRTTAAGMAEGRKHRRTPGAKAEAPLPPPPAELVSKGDLVALMDRIDELDRRVALRGRELAVVIDKQERTLQGLERIAQRQTAAWKKVNDQ